MTPAGETLAAQKYNSYFLVNMRVSITTAVTGSLTTTASYFAGRVVRGVGGKGREGVRGLQDKELREGVGLPLLTSWREGEGGREYGDYKIKRERELGCPH